MYRYPTGPLEDSLVFYQEEYEHGFTNEMPAADSLKQLINSCFAGHEKDYAPFIALLSDLGMSSGMRIFDFGCSWGFGSWQFAQAGRNVKSFGISRPRARHAREKLGVDVIDDISELEVAPHLDDTYDLFFSNQVLEHVPSPSVTVLTARRLLKLGGLFVATTPNGSLGYRDSEPLGWHRFWGKVHSNILNNAFWAHEFSDVPYFLGSLPDNRDRLADWAAAPSQFQDKFNGDRLICSTLIRAVRGAVRNECQSRKIPACHALKN